MEQKDFIFDPVRDLQDVDQFGFVDLNEAIANGVVPSDLNVNEETFNGIEDPRSIIGKPMDTFEAYRMASYIAEHGKADVPAS